MMVVHEHIAHSTYLLEMSTSIPVHDRTPMYKYMHVVINVWEALL